MADPVGHGGLAAAQNAVPDTDVSKEVLSVAESSEKVSMEKRILNVSQQLHAMLQAKLQEVEQNGLSKKLNPIRRLEDRRRSGPLYLDGVDDHQIWVQIDSLGERILSHIRANVVEIVSKGESIPNIAVITDQHESTTEDGTTTDGTENDEDNDSNQNDTDDSSSFPGASDTATLRSESDADEAQAAASADERTADAALVDKTVKLRKRKSARAKTPSSSDTDKVDFFNLEEMNRFMEDGDGGRIGDSDEEDNDGDMPKAVDDVLSEEVPASDSNDSTEESSELAEDEADETSSAAEERELDALLDTVEPEAESGNEEDEENGSDDGKQGFPGSERKRSRHPIGDLAADSAETDGDVNMTDGTFSSFSHERFVSKTCGSSLLALAEKNAALDSELEQIERELVDEKHWSLKGEATGAQREKNSLLDLHLDLPFYHHRHNADALLDAHLPDSLSSKGGDTLSNLVEAEEGEDGVPLTASGGTSSGLSRISADIERIVKQRIADVAFDDVVRKTVLPPAERAQNTAVTEEEEVLQFKKSAVGLADLYAEKYLKEVLGGKSSAELELDKNRAAIARLFGTIMYKLDSLSHQRTMKKPSRETAGAPGDVAAVTVEDTIPAVVSEAQRKAPEEVLAPTAEKSRGEMTQEEKRATRNAQKEKRRSQIKKKLESGEVRVLDIIERRVRLNEKNKQTKEDKKARLATGMGTRRTAQNSMALHSYGTKRLNANALLADTLDKIA